jgi:hypothetical protein
LTEISYALDNLRLDGIVRGSFLTPAQRCPHWSVAALTGTAVFDHDQLDDIYRNNAHRLPPR